MARIFTAAPGLVKLMQGQPYSATGLSKAYEMNDATSPKALQDAPSFGSSEV